MPDAPDDKEVLGSLPRRRPGIESPRRASARAAAAKGAAAPPGESEGEASQSEPGDLEQLARAGVRLAGSAATAGLKLAGRTVGGLGRAVGRR